MNKLTCLFLLLLLSCSPGGRSKIKISGTLKKWQTVTLVIRGPETSEYAKENPFLDYRLEVTFRKGSRTFLVPGFYAADGNAAETSADKGNIWKVRFMPDETGSWGYNVSFREGKDIALNEDLSFGDPLPADGATGSFNISAPDSTSGGFLSRGRLVNGGNGYLKFQDSGDVWIKNGADSPENFLAYEGFDQTLRYNLNRNTRAGEADPKKSLHKYEPHIKDWKSGDPTWQGGKGKGIMGALNYLASEGVNSQYMLTLNILGDGNDVWPYNDYNERYRFDCSKLDQWEIVFSQMDRLGIMMHFVLQETENECLLDNGNTDVQRMLYLRELVARFAHHPGVTWNLGEENGPAPWSPIGQTDQQRKDMANYLRKINPYPSFIVLHTHSDDQKQDEYLNPLLGFKNLDGPSMQVGDPSRVHERIKKWVDESSAAGRRWVVNLDEIGPSGIGVKPDSADAAHDKVRQQCLWGALMAGGGGVEWYFGYRYPDNDLTCENYRSREKWWQQSRIATSFFSMLPVDKMKSSDNLTDTPGVWCFAREGDVYVVYLPAGIRTARLQLNTAKKFTIKWLSPREGGQLQTGSLESAAGPGKIAIGYPPADDGQDWVALLE